MSVTKFMHPRNIYKNPPNFKQMAIDYPEFRKYVKQDITGKIRIDFKDNETLKCLTQTLLKKDFDLDVFIPLNRLIPTVPLRLNYILWIEDLLSITQENQSETTYGLDIGTGASCIYPLLCAKKNKWKMLASEIDEESLNHAQENVRKNSLQHLITIVPSKDHLLTNIIDKNTTYDFCMCNPPFFCSVDDLDPFQKARKESRTLPRNASSGSEIETIVHGGEIEFVSKLIHESVQIKTQIKVFTTMVGHKSSLAPLKTILRNIEVVSFKQTEFHQGHTTRWGLAWTFYDFDLKKIPETVKKMLKKKPKPPQKFILPPSYKTFKDILPKTIELFQILHLTYEEIKKNNFMIAFHLTAHENTWSHQRRKRREEKRKNDTSEINNDTSFVSTSSKSDLDDSKMSTDEENDKKRQREDSEDELCVKKMKINEDEDIYLKFTCIIRKLSDEYHLEMSYISGTANKDSVHQVIQYFKNNFK